MRIPVIIVAMAVATVSGTRPSRAFDSSDYRDVSSTYFDSPPPPISQPPRYLSHPYSSRVESLLRQAYASSDYESGSDFSDGPPTDSYHEPRLFFDSPPRLPADSYFPPSRKPASFNQGSASAAALRTTFGSAHEYQGPPPPRGLQSENSLKQTLSLSSSSDIRDERPFDSSDLLSTKTYQEPRIQQQSINSQLRQPISFGGHGSHLSFGDHSLGFASVAAITSSDYNPLTVGELTATTTTGTGTGTRGNSEGESSHPMQHHPVSSFTTMTTSAGDFQFTQRQQQQQPISSHSTSRQPDISTTSTATTSAPRIASTSQAMQSSPSTAKLNDPTSPSTTPATTRLTSVAPKSGLDPVENQLNQMSKTPIMMVQETPKPSYVFRTIEAQDLPPAAHGQLPIEPPKQQIHIPDIKHNLLIYDSKPSFPSYYQQPSKENWLQFNQQSIDNNNNNNNNIAPLRFSIGTTPIATNLINQNSMPLKIAIQGVEYSRSPITFTTVGGNTNTYTTGQNQLDIAQFNRLTPEVNSGSNLASYYIVQNNNQVKPAAPVTSGIPLGSFFLLPNNEQVKNIPQTNSNVPSGLQLQLSGYNGATEYFVPSSNSEQMRLTNLDVAKVGLNLQERFNVHEPSYAKIEYQQGRW